MFEKSTSNLNQLRLKDKKLYLITSRDDFDSDDAFLDAIASALNGGVDLVQLREKTATAKKIIELGKKIRGLCSIYNALFIVNDRVDIAKIVEADGVHLGQNDVDIENAWRILGKDAIIGVSVHCSEEITAAIALGADYVSLGPVFESFVETDKTPIGQELLKWAKNNINIPWYAFDEINGQNVGDVLGAGATRIVVGKEIMNAKSPEDVSRNLKKLLDSTGY